MNFSSEVVYNFKSHKHFLQVEFSRKQTQRELHMQGIHQGHLGKASAEEGEEAGLGSNSLS